MGGCARCLLAPRSRPFARVLRASRLAPASARSGLAAAPVGPGAPPRPPCPRSLVSRPRPCLSLPTRRSGERGDKGTGAGQRPQTATAHPPTQSARAPTRREPGRGQRPQKTGQRAEARGDEQRPEAPAEGPAPRSEEASTERRAPESTQRTHPPRRPRREDGEGPAVRADLPRCSHRHTILVGNTRGVVAGELPGQSRASPPQPAPLNGVSPAPHADELGRGEGVGETLSPYRTRLADGSSSLVSLAGYRPGNHHSVPFPLQAALLCQAGRMARSEMVA